MGRSRGEGNRLRAAGLDPRSGVPADFRKILARDRVCERTAVTCVQHSGTRLPSSAHLRHQPLGCTTTHRAGPTAERSMGGNSWVGTSCQGRLTEPGLCGSPPLLCSIGNGKLSDTLPRPPSKKAPTVIRSLPFHVITKLIRLIAGVFCSMKKIKMLRMRRIAITITIEEIFLRKYQIY